MIKAAIATRESDAKLRAEYRNKGRLARRSGQPRTPPGDPTSMIAGWWLSGYDSEDLLRSKAVNSPQQTIPRST